MTIEFELTFAQAPRETYKGLKDSLSIYTLTQPDYWLKNLKIWSKFIRESPNFICYEAVRKASSLSMGLEFTDDSTIKELNTAWRLKSVKTDVLSFPILDDQSVFPANECVELGDIVVSIPTAQKQALDFNHPLYSELRWLVSHGFLHLIGWEHPDAKTLEEMLSCQRQLLTISDNLTTSFEIKEECSDFS